MVVRALTVVLLVAGACQQREATPPSGGSAGSAAAGAGAGSAYLRDLDRICRVEEYATRDQPGAEVIYATAIWLDRNLETTEARAFMVRVSQAADAEKAGVIDAELARVGVTAPCPTARAWDPRPPGLP